MSKFNRNPMEVFVIVRPPPSLSNSPLNLQIQFISTNPTQLLNPNLNVNESSSRRSSTTRRDSEASTESNEGSLIEKVEINNQKSSMRRSGSVRSNNSRTSSSGSSFGGNGTRKVIPLYNLTFSSILPTVVTDAGTDEKIAKFLKRGGIELLDFAIIDPILAGLESKERKKSANILPIINKRSSSVIIPPSPISSDKLSIPSVISTAPTPTNSFLSKFKRLSFKSPSSPSTTPLQSPSSSSFNPFNVFKPDNTPIITKSGATVIPLFDSEEKEGATESKNERSTSGYDFVIRKLKEGESTELNRIIVSWRKGVRGGVRERAGSDDTNRITRSNSNLPIPINEKSERKTKSFDSPRTIKTNQPISSNSLEGTSPTSETLSIPPTPLMETRSISSKRQSYRSIDSSVHDLEGADDDEDDLETPWICSIKVLSTKGEMLKSFGISKLTPSPYHKHIIGNIIISKDLEEIQLDKEGAFLSVERIRDLSFVTGLWLTVREELGGLDKPRKGDRKR